MSELAKQLRKSRERTVKIEGFTFRYRRPTDYEIAQIARGGITSVEIAERFVIGWEGVLEQDILKGTSDSPAEFGAELWFEWCRDRPDFWSPLREAVMESYQEHCAKREASEKNS